MRRSVHNRYLLISDLLLLSLAAYASFVLRLERLSLQQFWLGYATLTLIALFTIPLSLYVMRGYAYFWHYASTRELTLLASRNALSADFPRILGLIRSGRIDTRPWISHRAAWHELDHIEHIGKLLKKA